MLAFCSSLMFLALNALKIALVCMAARLVWWLMRRVIAFIQHERLMRPQHDRIPRCGHVYIR